MEMILGENLWNRLSKVAIMISMVGVTGLIIMLWGPMVKILQNPQTTGSAFDPPSPTYIKTMFVFAGILYLLQLTANLFTPSKELAKPAEIEAE
jgi:hypothetical protein